MQINHNIRAMVTQHALFQNNNAMSKSLEKLSTGLRINRAQDDAAGLAMSEQMRTQIKGLGKARQNAQDGQAALQIAEGGLAEITNCLQRQRELAIQSANDTLTSTERKYLDDEFQALTKEIDRIAKGTDYNGKNVLVFDADPDKSFGAVKVNTYTKSNSLDEATSLLQNMFGYKLDGAIPALSSTYGGSASNAIAAMNAINKVIVGMGNVKPTEDTIKGVLEAIIAASNTTVTQASATAHSGAASIAAGGSVTAANKVGGDNVGAVFNSDLAFANTVSFLGISSGGMAGGPVGAGVSIEDKELLQSVSKFIKDVNLALDNWNASVESRNNGVQEGASDALKRVFATYFGDGQTVSGITVPGGASAGSYNIANRADNAAAISTIQNGVDANGVAVSYAAINQMGSTTGNYQTLAASANRIIGQINAANSVGGFDVDFIDSLFGKSAANQTMNDLKTIMNFDLDNMKGNDGVLVKWDDNDKQLAMALKSFLTEAKEAHSVYNYAGTSASEILHIGPNYSTGLGGAFGNQINVNYISVNVRDLGLERQSIAKQGGAEKAIDQLGSVIKDVSGARASIGTYINRLDYTVNNIASLEFNTQDAESRIRDTNFAKETTEFTKNQIMVQSATSILAQANMLPQSVLSLLG